MAEPGTGAAVAVSAVAGMGLVAMPGVDASAVVGGFGGALFFVVFARDPSFWASVGYLLSSWVFGYFVAAEIIARGLLNRSGLAAMVGALVFVVLATGLLQWLKGGKAPFWFRYLPGLGGKRDG